MDARKNKKVKSILGFLQEDVPGAPVDAQEMDEVETPAGAPPPDMMDGEAEHETENMPGGMVVPPVVDGEDDLLRKKRKRRGMASGADEMGSLPAFLKGAS